MKKDSKIYIAGHTGLVGSAIVRQLIKLGYTNLIQRTRLELNLLDLIQVEKFFKAEKPEFVFLAAAKVGGILANSTSPAQFIYENLQIQNNVIHQAYLQRVKKLLFLGSSCIYPRDCPQPMKEEYLLSGYLEPTNEPYAIAKIAGIKMCQGYNRQYGTNFISVMPTNLYGPNDNFDPETSHVIPALIRKFHEAKERGMKQVVIWGSGEPRREFLQVDDLADACIFLMNNYNSSEIINIGSGDELSIKQLAELIKKIVGYQGRIVWDKTKPDGPNRKFLDPQRLKEMGWRRKIGLNKGLIDYYEYYRQRAADNHNKTE